MATLPSVIATYRLDGRRYRLVKANLMSMSLGEGVYWLLHGQEIVDTMAAPYAADVVGLLKDNTSYGVAGDHGGAQRPVQEIPIVFGGRRRRAARLAPGPALGRHPADRPAQDGHQARAGSRRQGGGAAALGAKAGRGDADGLGVKSSLAIALAALALTPAAAAADEPVTSVSVTVEVGAVHGTTSAFEAPEAACAPQLTMRLDQRPLRWRRGVPVLRTGRSYRFAGRLTCAPEGTVVETADGTATVGADGRIATRVAYRGGRTIAFSAHGAAVRIAVRARQLACRT